jgi:secreted protein with Ig-like and vWFA domain
MAFQPLDVHIYRYMAKAVEDSYLAALELVMLSDLSRSTGRAYRTLQAYRKGDRRVTPAAARELIVYLRSQAQAFTAAAEQVEAAITEEEAE